MQWSRDGTSTGWLEAFLCGVCVFSLCPLWVLSRYSELPPKDMYVNWILGVDEWLSHYVGSVIDL